MVAIGNRPLELAGTKQISCKGFWLLLAIYCIFPIAVHPQTPDSAQDTSQDVFSRNLMQHVPNLPYIAQGVHSYLEDGTLARRETRVVQMRDSQGRTRLETFNPGSNLVSDKPATVILYNPLRRQLITLVVAPKKAFVMTLPSKGPDPAPGTDPIAAATTKESLPGRMVHGIYAVGTRTTVRVPSYSKTPEVADVQESWLSPDLKIVVLVKRCRDGEEDNIVWEIQKLDRSEPDAALFEIPADYKIVPQENGSHTGSSPETVER